MYRQITFTDNVKVPPQLLGEDVEAAVLNAVQQAYEGSVTEDLGVVLSVNEVADIGEGDIRPEDAGVYYPVTCEAVSYMPELHEIILGEVSEITEFGAFIDIGPVEALCHVSQIMDDYVSYNEDQHLLSGEDGNKILQEGDVVKARITGVSIGDPHSHKINLTMRQPGLGKLDWIEDAAEEAAKDAEDE